MRAYLAEVDEAEKERRDGLGEKIEEVLELVKHQGDRISEQNDRLSGEARQHADEVIGTIRRDRRATERVYALVEGVHFPPEQREEAHEAADEQASKRLRVEEQRKREREARWRAGEEKASDGGEEAGPVEGSG
ncbi:MAG: hypothetical protein L0G70_03725 [Rubrobacter sp.]|nr:hypothetical protein [Rubrobacter sp.]